MRKNVYGVLGLVILLGALCVLGWTKVASAAVQVNINLGPPPIRVAEPPEMVMIPGIQVYFVPGLEFDVFFYNGYWWSPRGNRWYRSRDYNGPWKTISRFRVPSPVSRVPKDYRSRYEKQQHIPYGQWKNRGKDNKQNNNKDNRQDNKNDRGHNN
jgi:hypothetical protein